MVPGRWLRFFGWLDEVRPTWYTAVPTMHQAILARAERNAQSVARARLRLVRSSSASLPPQVMLELERVFRAPVIESYGMTEAAHQMASNPLPPRPRKPGSVGVAAGPVLERATREAAYGAWLPGHRLLATAQSRRGPLDVIGLREQASLYRHGHLDWTSPDPEGAALRAHLALCLHPAPRRVFLAGGGPGGC